LTKIDPLHKFFMGFYVALLIIILFILATTNSCERPVKYITNTTIDTVYTTDTVQITTSGMELVAKEKGDCPTCLHARGRKVSLYFCDLHAEVLLEFRGIQKAIKKEKQNEWR